MEKLKVLLLVVMMLLFINYYLLPIIQGEEKFGSGFYHHSDLKTSSLWNNDIINRELKEMKNQINSTEEIKTDKEEKKIKEGFTVKENKNELVHEEETLGANVDYPTILTDYEKEWSPKNLKEGTMMGFNKSLLEDESFLKPEETDMEVFELKEDGELDISYSSLNYNNEMKKEYLSKLEMLNNRGGNN